MGIFKEISKANGTSCRKDDSFLTYPINSFLRNLHLAFDTYHVSFKQVKHGVLLHKFLVDMDAHLSYPPHHRGQVNQILVLLRNDLFLELQDGLIVELSGTLRLLSRRA